MTKRAAFLLPFLISACQAPPPAAQAPVTREAINSQLPARPYSQAVRVGDTFWFSGKLGVTDETLAMEEGRIEVISGVNLPILIKAINARKDMELGKLAQNLEAFGKTTIKLASGILKGNKRSKSK